MQPTSPRRALRAVGMNCTANHLVGYVLSRHHTTPIIALSLAKNCIGLLLAAGHAFEVEARIAVICRQSLAAAVAVKDSITSITADRVPPYTLHGGA